MQAYLTMLLVSFLFTVSLATEKKHGQQKIMPRRGLKLIAGKDTPSSSAHIRVRCQSSGLARDGLYEQNRGSREKPFDFFGNISRR